MVLEAGRADKKRDRGIPGHDDLDVLLRRPEPRKKGSELSCPDYFFLWRD
jgi:hypothetical protein